MKWHSIGIAEPVVQRIKKLLPALGYVSIGQFVGEAVRAFLEKREQEYDEIELERKTGREVLGKTRNEED